MPIDLKTETPDTSIPAGAFVFGADSQSAAAPSVYPAKDMVSATIADLAQTWNASGTTFTGLLLNVTDTASAAASLLADLQVGGTSRFKVAKTGTVSVATGTVTASTPLLDLTQTWNASGTTFTALRLNVTNTASATASDLFDLQVGGASQVAVTRSGGIKWPNGTLENSSSILAWSGIGARIKEIRLGANALTFGVDDTGSNRDLYILRDGAANILAQRNGTAAQTFRLYSTFTASDNFQRLETTSAITTLSALSGATVTATALIPDGAVVVGVTTRVSTLITGATGYQVGTSSDADRWGDITGTAVGTTSDNTNWTSGTVECFTAATDVVITANGSNFTAGAIVVTVHYLIGRAD
jgi:hypothetical protein